MNHARQALVLSALLVLSAAALALWPHQPELAAIPVALKVLMHGGLAVRHHRKQKRILAKFNRGMPIKHGGRW